MEKSPIKKISRRSYRNNSEYQLRLSFAVAMSKDLAAQKANFPNQPFIIWRDDNTGEVHTIKSDEDIAGIVHLPRSTIYDRRKTPQKFLKDTFGPGPATILDTFLENEIVNHCTTPCDKGFGIS